MVKKSQNAAHNGAIHLGFFFMYVTLTFLNHTLSHPCIAMGVTNRRKERPALKNSPPD